MYSTDDLKKRIRDREICIGILGLGYVGLPLAGALAEANFKVIGYDTDSHKIDAFFGKENYLTHIDFEKFRTFIVESKFIPVKNHQGLESCNVYIICVPTPLTAAREPDLVYVITSCKVIGKYLKRDDIVVLESTTYPGTTRTLVKDLLNKLSGLHAGVDYVLAFSPEREDPGNPKYNLKNTPKVVGGLTPGCTDVVSFLYSHICTDLVEVSSPDTAEIVKIFENVYRSVNIALVNELKLLCHRMGIDVWEVIRAAATKPFGFQKFEPSAGVGGHCIDGHELITLKTKNHLTIDTIENVFTAYAKRFKFEDVINDIAVIQPVDVEILSFDPQAKGVCWRKLTHLFRRSGSFNILEFEFTGGEKLSITDGHPVFDVQKSPWRIILARQLNRDDLFPQVDVSKYLRSDNFEDTSVVEFTCARIKDIQKKETDFVYSVEVDGTKTFVTSHGFVLHNCIPLDPFYLTWRAREFGMQTKFIELSGEINSKMPEYVFSRIQYALNLVEKSVSGSDVLVVGIAYKKNIGDIRESPSIPILEMLVESRANVFWCDPYVASAPVSSVQKVSGETDVTIFDCIVILTAHDCIDYKKFTQNNCLIVDTRGVIPREYPKLVPA